MSKNEFFRGDTLCLTKDGFKPLNQITNEDTIIFVKPDNTLALANNPQVVVDEVSEYYEIIGNDYILRSTIKKPTETRNILNSDGIQAIPNNSESTFNLNGNDITMDTSDIMALKLFCSNYGSYLMSSEGSPYIKISKSPGFKMKWQVLSHLHNKCDKFIVDYSQKDKFCIYSNNLFENHLSIIKKLLDPKSLTYATDIITSCMENNIFYTYGENEWNFFHKDRDVLCAVQVLCALCGYTTNISFFKKTLTYLLKITKNTSSKNFNEKTHSISKCYVDNQGQTETFYNIYFENEGRMILQSSFKFNSSVYFADMISRNSLIESKKMREAMEINNGTIINAETINNVVINQ